MKDTATSVREGGKRIWRGKCLSDPKLGADITRKHAPHARRVAFENGAAVDVVLSCANGRRGSGDLH
ncbi:Transposase (plasmid) [Sinorhizobium meliloti SM11]|uniref:Transposase n=1 Tax=Sinorhizobium meliloti (strain SM11) TaxID=707241 RepID=F7XBA0_SINMM|nr:Transposase [Sinorhizobium meliloti SM11]GEC41694.1 hypothetical protein EME01_57660 [Sinorhizobium meliloti]